MDKLKIRSYHVRFGDAYLLQIPDKDKKGNIKLRHILIDVGNSFSKEGGKNDVFKPIIEDILKVLDGKPLDLYIMTHEHMDHVQGLQYCDKHVLKGEVKERLKTQYSWLTASSKQDYYAKHPKAKEAKLNSLKSYFAISAYLSKMNVALSENMSTLLFNNNPNRTKDCVSFIKNLARKGKTFYVHSDFKLNYKKHHNFNEVNFEIWGPEEDTSIYYKKLKPLASVSGKMKKESVTGIEELIPPKGVNPAVFREIMGKRNAVSDNMLAIDKARNNTSIVLFLEWRGWKILFPGDAEERSWEIMNRKDVLKPIHFLKVGHHGSHNGTPHEETLNKILPHTCPDGKERFAVVSTFEGQYNNVPHRGTLELVKSRCSKLYELHNMESVKPGGFVDVEFEG